MMVQIFREEVLEQIHAHALRAFPFECCGMVCSDGTVRKCENAIDRFHAADPEAFPRTRVNGYCFEFEDLLFLDRSQSGPSPVVAVYHSHPDGTSVFSGADRAAAMADGVPVYPALLHLIVGVDLCGIVATRCYGYADGGYREMGVWKVRGAGGPDVDVCGSVQEMARG